MKQTRMLVNWLVASAVAFAMVTSASAQAVKERTAKVVRIKGQARYSTGNNVWQPLTVGTTLRSGSLVQTARGSYVDVVLGEVAAAPPSTGAGAGGRPVTPNDIIRVLDDSVVGIDKLTAVDTGADKVTETQLDLRSGRILGSVKKMPAASRFEVKVPNGVAGIRGTLFAISADGVVSVGAGSVVISWTKADGTTGTQVVTEGFQFDVKTGELTKIPDLIFDQLKQFQLEGVVYGAGSSRFEVDQTIYRVSPN